MQYSGLRIGDTIAPDESRINGKKLLLYTAKTGTPVYVPLPAEVISALQKIGTNDGGRFFSTGKAKPQTARANWSRYLDSLFELASIKGGHSHRLPRFSPAAPLRLARAWARRRPVRHRRFWLFNPGTGTRRALFIVIHDPSVATRAESETVPYLQVAGARLAQPDGLHARVIRAQS